MLKGIQIIGILVCVILLTLTILQFQKERRRIGTFSIWIAIWTIGVIIFVFPSIGSFVLEFVTLQSNVVVFTIVGLLGAYILIFKAYRAQLETEKKLTELIQAVALHEHYGKRDRKE